MSASSASSSASSGSFDSSPGSKRTFSSMATDPGVILAAAAEIASPRQPGSSSTGASKSSESRADTGARDRSETGLPPGRPRWVTIRTRHERSVRNLMVGMVDRIRESSRISLVPGRIGRL